MSKTLQGISLLYLPFIWLALIPFQQFGLEMGPESVGLINAIILVIFFGALHSAGSTLILFLPRVRQWYLSRKLKRILLGVPLIGATCFVCFYLFSEKYLLQIVLFYLLASFYHKQMQSFGVLQFFNRPLNVVPGLELGRTKGQEQILCHIQYAFYALLIFNMFLFKNAQLLIVGTLGALICGLLISLSSYRILQLASMGKDRFLFSLRFVGYSLLGLSPFAFVFTSATHASEYQFVLSNTAGKTYLKSENPKWAIFLASLYIIAIGSLFILDTPVLWAKQDYALLSDPFSRVLASLTFAIAFANFYIDSIIFRKSTSKGLNLVDSIVNELPQTKLNHE